MDISGLGNIPNITSQITAGAPQAGASAGEKLTAQAADKAPKAARWSVSMRSD